MRTAILNAYGPPDALQIEEIPDPELLTPTDVRIAVHTAAINPIDWKIRAGKQRGAIRYRLPHVLGLDVAGEVLEVGSGVTRLAVGDAVLGCPDFRRNGSYAEQCVLDEAMLVHKPEAMSWAEAAALPLAGLTAWQCLLPRLAERPGQRVLIQAGSGGVGHLAIQIAKHHGAWVAVTCSERNRDFVTGLGADRVVDYRNERWWEVLEPVDVILDALGGEERELALRHVARGGRVASIVSGLPEYSARFGPTLGVAATGLGIAWLWLRGVMRGVQASTIVKRTRVDHLEALLAIDPKVHVERSFALDDVADAHAYGETGRIRGKVVIQVRGTPDA